MNQQVVDRMQVVRAPETAMVYAKTPADWAAIQWAKDRAGADWADVCWNALPCLEAGVDMRQALETGLYECGIRYEERIAQ